MLQSTLDVLQVSLGIAERWENFIYDLGSSPVLVTKGGGGESLTKIEITLSSSKLGFLGSTDIQCYERDKKQSS